MAKRFKKICDKCGKTFEVFPSRVKIGRSKFCSRTCYWETMVGKLPPMAGWNLGKKMSPSYRKKLSSMRMGHIVAEETKEKLRAAKLGSNNPMYGKELTKDHIRKCLRRRKMSNIEKMVDGVIKKYELPFKFVGNGKFFIERKNPDFVNTNGKKIAIEVYWKRHKDMFRGGSDKWRSERQGIFSSYGWNIIFIEGTGLTEDKIIRSLQGGY